MNNSVTLSFDRLFDGMVVINLNSKSSTIITLKKMIVKFSVLPVGISSLDTLCVFLYSSFTGHSAFLP